MSNGFTDLWHDHNCQLTCECCDVQQYGTGPGRVKVVGGEDILEDDLEDAEAVRDAADDELDEKRTNHDQPATAILLRLPHRWCARGSDVHNHLGSEKQSF